MDIKEFLVEYYLEPLGKYYTLPATLTYAALFLIGIYLVYKLCEKLKLKFTESFIKSLLPFILLGGVVRALRDAEIIYSGYFFVSPPIYFFIFLLTLTSISISKTISNFTKLEFNKTLLLLGCALLFIHSVFIALKNFVAIGLILFLWFSAVFSIFFLSKFFPKIFSSLNSLAISAQLLDGISASVSISLFGYGEQHVVSGFIISLLGAWSFIPTKFIVSIFAVYMIDKYSDDKNFSNFLKFIIIVLGLALGLRNTLRAGMEV